jgi:hypothetical protein
VVYLGVRDGELFATYVRVSFSGNGGQHLRPYSCGSSLGARAGSLFFCTFLGVCVLLYILYPLYCYYYYYYYYIAHQHHDHGDHHEEKTFNRNSTFLCLPFCFQVRFQLQIFALTEN